MPVVRLSDKTVGLTELDKTQRNISLLCAVLKWIIISIVAPCIS